MISILNEYSPINPPSMSSQPNSDNDLIINSTLPARKTINIYGIWDGTQYAKQTHYWTPSSVVKVVNPATTTSGLGEDTRVLKTPDYPEITVDDSDYVALKGFATKETVANFLENTLMPDGQFSAYFDMLVEEWGMDNLADYITDGEGNFEFSEDKYNESDFPFELLFECSGADIYPLIQSGELVFPSSDGMDAQDMFAIYQRMSYRYTFYYPDNTIYETEDVLFGEHPTDPTNWSTKPFPDAPPDTRYRLVNDGDGAWSAVEDSSSVGGDYIYSKSAVDTVPGRTWRDTTVAPHDADWVDMMDYTAGTQGQSTTFIMRQITSVPVIFVIDGIPEGFAGSYGAQGGVDSVTGYQLRNYTDYYDYTNNDTVRINLNSGYHRASTPTVFEDTTSNNLIKDPSILWFYDSACYSDRLGRNSSDGVSYYSRDDKPVILYTKLRDVKYITFTDLDGGSVEFNSVIFSSYPTYAYLDGLIPKTITYKEHFIRENKVYATQGARLRLGSTSSTSPSGAVYIKNTDTQIKYVDIKQSSTYAIGSWRNITDATDINVLFFLNNNITAKPIPVTYSKPKMHMTGIDPTVIVNTSGVDTDVYSVTVTSAYIDVVAKAATAQNISTAWVFDMTQFSFSKDGYSFTGYTPSSPSAVCGATANVTINFEKNGSTLRIDSGFTRYFNSHSSLNSLKLYHTWTRPSGSGGDYSNPVIMNTNAVYEFTQIKTISDLSVDIDSSEPLAEFVGFSTDQAGNNMVTFPLQLENDTKLYAQYRPVTYTLKYYYNDRNFCDQEVLYDPISGSGESVDMAAIDTSVSPSYYPAINWDGNGSYSPSITATLYRYGTPSADSTTKSIPFKSLRSSYGALGSEYAVGSSSTYNDISTNLNLVDYVDTYASTKIIPIYVRYKADGKLLSEDFLDVRWIAYKGSVPDYYYWAYAPDGESSPGTAVGLTNETRTASAGYFELASGAKYLMFEKSGAVFNMGANWGDELLYNGSPTQSIDITRYTYGQQTITIPRLGTDITCRYSTGLSIEGIIPVYPDQVSADNKTLPSDYKNDGIHSHIMRAFPLNPDMSTYYYRNKGVCAPATYDGYWRKGNNDYGYISKYSSAFSSWFWFEPTSKTAYNSGSIQINSGTVNTYYLCVPVEMGSIELNSYVDPTDFRFINVISVKCVDSWLNSHILWFFAPFYSSSSSIWSDGIHYPNKNYNQSAFTDFIYVEANNISSVSQKIQKLESDGLNLMISEDNGFYKIPSGKRNSSFLTAIDGVIYMLMLYTEQQ